MKHGQASFFRQLFQQHFFARLTSCGLAVGLPPGSMGDSNVNHLNMGAGRTVYQSIELVNAAIRDGSFFENEAFLTAIARVKENEGALHLPGVLQGHSGTVHGSIKHLFALLEMVKRHEVKNVYLELFTDGRDTNPQAARDTYLPMLEAKIREMGLEQVVKVGLVIGRGAGAMDRDCNWNLTELAMKALVTAQADHRAASAREAIENAYADGKYDEHIPATIIGDFPGIGPKDAIIFINFRQDRAIQLTTAFRETDPRFFNYKGSKVVDPAIYQRIIRMQQGIEKIPFVGMTQYYAGMNSLVAFPEQIITETVGEVVAAHNLRQLRLAGTEKFPHVTGWFSGRRQQAFAGEDRIMVSDETLQLVSEQGQHYDRMPEMTVYLETERALQAMVGMPYALIVHNIQNGDMVGHTGNLEAAISAISHVSGCVNQLATEWVRLGGVFVLTADHGNADEMLVRKGDVMVPSTQHSLNPVPFWALGTDVTLRPKGIVPDIGSTILDLMGLPIPTAMTAASLIAA